MCGFVGLVRRAAPHVQSTFPVKLLQRIERASITLENRGPDQSGLWSDGNCALAHRRLHVIGVSEDGQQPIQDKTNRYSMVYNGAVYNFKALAKDIGQNNLSAQSCDTATIIEGFAKEGENWFERLNGMFSIAIWDKEKTELWLARDRFGQKPLYYGWSKAGFVFGSELKSLLPLLEMPPTPNYTAIHNYLSFGYIPSSLTGFEGLSKLEAGCVLRLKMRGGNEPSLKIKKYRSTSLPRALVRSPQDLQLELKEKLELAVKRCLISSKPLGTFLSGGIDSSAITAITCGLSSNRVKTFSVGFESAGLDERKHARRVAEHLGTDHQDIVFRSADVVSSLDKLTAVYDEPFGDSSALPMMALSHMTKQSVTVALSGDGADELFMGYPRHLEMTRQQKLANMPKIAFKISRFLEQLSGSQRMRNLTDKHVMHASELYFPMVSQIQHDDKAAQYSEFMQGFLIPASSQLLRPSFDMHSDFVEGAMQADQDHYLPEDLLTKSDRAAMAVSLEVRTPFLDNDLVEFANRVPWSSKSYDGRLKALLKDSVASLLPRETLNRPKQGFSVPLEAWLNGPLKNLIHDLLLSKDGFVLTLFQRSYVERLLQSCADGVGRHEHRIWSLLVLELWAQKWLVR